MGQSDFSALEDELGLLLRRGSALGREVAELVHPGLNSVYYATLVRIESGGPVRATALCEYFGIDKAAMSRQLRDLEGFGLIERTADARDGRAQTVALTADGAARLHEARAARRRRFRRLLKDWPDEDVATLGRLLAQLNRTL